MVFEWYKLRANFKSNNSLTIIFQIMCLIVLDKAINEVGQKKKNIVK